jgi:hypothetical protein
MTDIQENKLSMYEALKIIFGNFSTVYETFNDFKAYVTLFLANIEDIHGLRAVQERDNKGVALNKDNIAMSLSDIATKVKNAAVAHAIFTKDLKLREKVDYTDTELKNCRDNILADRAKVIYDAALPLKAHLTKLNITEADITAVDTIRLQYLSVIAEPRVAIVETKSATASLARKFRETDKLLRNEIDPTIRIFENTNFDFVDQYKNGRIIVDLGKRSTGNRTAVISGTVRHFETLVVLPGALVRILETGQSVTVGADGTFSFTFSQSGVYTLQVELAGYHTYTEDGISIQTGNQLNLDIELEPVEV